MAAQFNDDDEDDLDLLADLDDLGEATPDDIAISREKAQHALTVSQFMASQRVQHLLSQIASRSSTNDTTMQEANELQTEIEVHERALHVKLLDIYAPIFPELPALVPNIVEYHKCVRILAGREHQAESLVEELKQVIDPGRVLVITMAATTATARTQQHVAEGVLQEIQQICQMADELEAIRITLLAFVESCMDQAAPNLVQLVGTTIAAQLVGAAGGIKALSRIPACNIERLGATKRDREASAGMSAVALAGRGVGRHGAGFVFWSELVQRQPVDERMRTNKMVCAKCALVARVDAAGESKDGAIGKKFREGLEGRIEKIQEPPKAKRDKALPVPIVESGKKRRGGRRARAQKELQKQSELRKLQNRLKFADVERGEEELDGMDETEGMGMFSSAGLAESGRVRLKEDGRKMHLSAKMQKRLKIVSGTATSAPVSGLATSLAFTPHQGLELEATAEEKKRKVTEANSKWFGGIPSSVWKRRRMEQSHTEEGK